MSEGLDLDAIEARANAATPGPWLPGGNSVTSHDGIALFRTYSWMVDEEFVAHARADVPALVAEVRRLRDEIARMRERGAS